MTPSGTALPGVYGFVAGGPGQTELPELGRCPCEATLLGSQQGDPHSTQLSEKPKNLYAK